MTAWRRPPVCLTALTVAVAAAGCAPGSGRSGLAANAVAAGPRTPSAHGLQALAARTLRANPSFPGVAVVVRGPGLRVGAAVGAADRAGGRPLTAGTPMRIASVTKTFTAAAILRLVEQRRLGLDDVIAKRLGPASSALLRADGYPVGRITVRMLLQHTSGIADFAALPSYQSAVAATPRHRWTRHEQLRFAVAHTDPLAAPGRRFAYSDTGYILLGEILERTTRLPTAVAYRRLLPLRRLGLGHTYLETLERPRGAAVPRAHQYLGTLDAAVLDPSFDLWGAGGLVSTLDDLARFYQALLGGRVLARPATLALMRGAARPERVRQLGMGLFAVRLGGEDCWGHQGFWGVDVTACPRSGITIASTVNQALGFERPSLALHERARALATGVPGSR